MLETMNILVLFGIVLSFFLVILILSSKSFRSDVHLFFAITLLSLNCCLTYTWFADYVPANGILEIISWDFLFPFAFLMYVLRAIKHPLGKKRWIWLLALPCLVFSLFQTVDFIIGIDVYDWLAKGDDVRLRMIIEARAFSFLPFAIALVGFAWLKIKATKELYPKERRWLEFNSLAILAFLVSWLFSDPIATFFDFAIWEYLLAGLSIFLIITTYLGVHQLNTAEQRRLLKALQETDQPFAPLKLTGNSNNSPGNSTVMPKRGEEKMTKLHSLMTEQQLFLNPALSRTIVAQELGISDGYLSEILKNTQQTNFNDYINAFRVKRVISYFQEEKFVPYSIEAIGLEAGFKSKSVFYTAFKKVTGKTPGAYRKARNLS